MTHDKKPSRSRRTRPRFRGVWCECRSPGENPVFMPDFVCPCGVDKHHYHCPTCGCICQVG